MGFLDNLINLIPGMPGRNKPKPGVIIAGTFPEWEVSTPQYQVPTPYTMMREGYRTNEIIYSCIGLRSTAVGEAPIKVFDDTQDKPEEVKKHPLKLLLRHPNERISEAMFWQVTEMYLLIAGFCAWEKERNRLGEVIKLWPMRPDWCGFMRGENRLLDYIRYQPYGLPPVDVAIDDVLMFQYWDPLYPGLKGWSPTMQAYPTMQVDNLTTAFLNDFFKHGAIPAGLLKTAQSLNDIEARRIQQLWHSQHGGAGKWSQTAVLGSGVDWQSTVMTFKDMGFGDLDARSESRLCGLFKVPPIMISAKIGLDRSTYSNYGEAKASFYENTINNEWGYLGSMVEQQLLPDFEETPDDFHLEFDKAEIRALQEDRTSRWSRAIQAAQANVITRDESREELGLDPIDDAPVFVGNAPPAVGEETLPAPEIPPELLAGLTSGSSSGSPQSSGSPVMTPEQNSEAKRFREYAARRRKEGKETEINQFKFKHIKGIMLNSLLREVGVMSPSSPFQGWDEY